MELIHKYFDKLSDKQISQYEQLLPLYKEWNDKINVISRKDIDNLYLHHVLHSLSIAKMTSWKAGAEIMDLGCGGGFPGIPLGIMFPEVKFTLIDGTRKKIKVVNEVAQAIGLDNVRGLHVRAEEHKKKYDFVVTRAVAIVEKLVNWSQPLIHQKHKHALPNGIIALKGGNIKQEVKDCTNKVYAEITPINDYFEESFFEEKCVVYIQR